MPEAEEIKGLRMKVAEAVQDDVNRGIVRMDTSMMRSIGIAPGDVIEIEGGRRTVGIVDRAYPGDIGLNIIRMDGSMRRNAKTSIGEVVAVRKAEVKPAKKIIIAPAKRGIVVKASPELFKQGLLGRPLMKGDLVSLGSARRRRSAFGSPFEDMFSVFDESVFGLGIGGMDIRFVVANANPAKEPVVVTEDTVVEYNPEAVELKEEVAAGINYEDVGGLGEAIKKIREMVELPLKHPEIFERLGIEAPKGVLLHGPPGTGKTLIAKAVASETNSHFILINAPEVMSKFYGESLPYAEKVLIKEDGMLKRVKIGELVESNQKNAEAICFDHNNNVVSKKIDRLIRHNRTSTLYTVKTRSGRSITVTADHSLFTLGESGIKEIKTTELVQGKSFIAIPQQLPAPKDPLYELDLIGLLRGEDYGLIVKNVVDYLEQAKNKIGVSQCAKILGVSKKYFSDMKGKNVGVPVTRFMKLMGEARIIINKKLLQIGTKRSQMPALLPITEELCHFFGWWIAEGSYMKSAVRLSLHVNELSYVTGLVQRLFGNCAVYHKKNTLGADIFIHSKVLCVVMQKVLECAPGSAKKHIPFFVYNIDRERLAAFLRGYFSGDGSVNTRGSAPQVEVSSVSEELIDDVAYLLLYFGIVAKIYNKPRENSKRLTFASYENLHKFCEIGFVDANRNKIIFDYINTKKFSRESQVPIVGKVLEAVSTDPQLSAWKNSRSIGALVLERHNPELYESLGLNDITFDRVEQISQERVQPEFVYDLSVPGAQNFIAGFGGIFAHNSEANIRKKFEEAEKNAPSIIFIDEIDAIAPKREETRGEVERRVVAQLLSMMDGLATRGKVVVIGATNRPNSLDPALRRPGRFDREVEINVPDKDGRLEIMKIHTRNMPLAKNVELKDIAAITHGFVGADLAALCKEAALVVLRRVLPDLKLEEEEPIPKKVLEQLFVTQKDFTEALKIVRPSAMREVLVEIPDVSWNDIGGLEEVKQKLEEAVEWPLHHPHSFKKMGIKPPKGILLYGAPGTGKTLMAKAVAKQTEANFILVNGPSLLSMWVGESEKALREIFKKARQTAPCIIFFDEIDALAPKRGYSLDSRVGERMVNQLLTEMDGLEELHDVVIIAATNRPDIVDPALLRPGRFDRIIHIPAPDIKARQKIFEVHTKEMPLAADVIVNDIAQKTEGYVGADIEAICREAAILALREDMKSKDVTMKHFEKALQVVRPSVDKEIEETYKELEKYFSVAKAREIKEEKPMYVG